MLSNETSMKTGLRDVFKVQSYYFEYKLQHIKYTAANFELCKVAYLVLFTNLSKHEHEVENKTVVIWIVRTMWNVRLGYFTPLRSKRENYLMHLYINEHGSENQMRKIMIGIETSVLKSKKRQSSNELILSQVGYTTWDILLFNDGNF